MTFEYRFTAEQEAFRGELRAFLAAELPDDWWQLQNDREEIGPARDEFVRGFRKRLAAKGWLTIHWPREYGGMGAGKLQQLIFNEEMGYHMAPAGGMGVEMAGPTLMHWGTEEQRAAHMQAIASGEEIWCQGFSEPGSGSDLASLRTRAARDGDDYVVNGQKIWTSGAHKADWCMVLVRSDRDAPKHRGISYLLMDMRSPGISIRPLINMLGSHAFNSLHLDDVRVPVRNLVGEENRGWYVATTTLDYERSGIARVMWGKRILEELARWLRDGCNGGRDVGAGAPVRNRLADLWITGETARLLCYRVAWLQSRAEVPNYEASMAKQFGASFTQALTQFGTNLLGPAGALLRGSAGHHLEGSRLRGGAPLFGALPLGYMATASYSIAGGTNEIQKGIIATRGLGLPRS